MKNPLILSLLLVCFVHSALSQDNPECQNKTFNFFTTFNGFYVERCKESEFGAYDFWLDGSSRKLVKQGKYREIWFRKKENEPRKVSGLQIIQNHVKAIQSIGGEVVKGSDDGIYKTIYQGNELWIHLKVYAGKVDVDNFGIFSIEVQPMKQEVSAKDIKGTIDSHGKIAVYGILFDRGKSDIKPESDNVIQEIATYLNENATINVYIVGHTDNVGDYASNLKLSRERGESVKKYLTSKYKINANRLTGDGAGAICPVASNDTEAGKKLNRRVEIVKK